MGSSNWQNISYSIDLIKQINPTKVLDVGIGFGKWGFLTREYLELWDGRNFKEDWKVQIDGVEIFDKNITEHQRAIYSNIYISDAYDFIKQTSENYDLIILGDVLEHFDKQHGKDFLKQCLETSEYVLLHIPIGKYWKQKELYGNKFEKHLSTWQSRDFDSRLLIRKKKFRDYIFRKFYVLLLSNKHDKIDSRLTITDRLKILLVQYPRLQKDLRLIKNFISAKHF